MTALEPARISSGQYDLKDVDLIVVGYPATLSPSALRLVTGSHKPVLNAELASDSIVEIAPRDGGAVCHRHGDEGHAAVVPDETESPVLVGLYVGSVTQWFSDCKKYLQYLNGYEATFGFAYAAGDGSPRALL